MKTNIVTSVEISDGYAHDYTYFKGLVDKTAKSGFTMKEVSADKRYLGASNMLATLQHGAVATHRTTDLERSSLWVSM